MDRLERLIDRLRAEVRRAAAGGDRDRASALRAELRQAERRWDDELARLEADLEDGPPVASSESAGPGSASIKDRVGRQASAASLPAREQVHQALTLLGIPAAPKLIVAVYDAFHLDGLPGAKLASLRRDEERSFRTAPYARPYYICAALTADLLSPARGLLAVSAWPMRARIIGPLSPRVDYLTAAIRIAQHCQDLPGDNGEPRRLLWRFAANIPRAASSLRTMELDEIVHAAQAELAVHAGADSEVRELAARRALDQLDDTEQLFGSVLGLSRRDAVG